ncbi:HAD-IA family hydrolase [Acinetobacter larvae]|uniref:Hydrolase n=1 Tax=Acinetobacter larvae TaxID=1789224 RepID=A0A1B2M3P8_9GAMM|nr:HAD-IA family hydrolase [Acinetobacter larvae]AOA59837.1 hydrolase [Acinetobacter larvae]
MIKNILIDLDGTLTNPQTGITGSARYGLAKVGHVVDDQEDLDWIIGPPLKASLAKILGVAEQDDLAEQALLGYRERFASIGLYENEVYADVAVTLAQLQQSGYQLFLATAKPIIYAKQILDHFHLLQYFTQAYGSELSGLRSHKAELIDYILQQEQLNPAECLMVGDREHDIFAARAHGIDTIAVNYGFGSEAELTQAAPRYRIDRFAELCDVMAGLTA